MTLPMLSVAVHTATAGQLRAWTALPPSMVVTDDQLPWRYTTAPPELSTATQ